MTLAEALHEAAARHAGVTSRSDGGATVWSATGRPFAATDGAVAEFRLKPVVARAALGTPDTSPSSRGADWIAFRPPELDRFALDRLTAWFGSAATLAGARRDDDGAGR